MTASFFTLPLNLTLEEVYPYLGIKDAPLSGELSKLIDHYLNIVRQTANPRAIRKTYKVNNISHDQITLIDSLLVLAGSGTARHFSSCSSVTLVAASIGAPIDALLADLGQRLPTHALICDGIASAAVEHLVEQADSIISQGIRRQGCFPTARFSPGYGDWPLVWQKAFLDSLEAEKIELSLTSHFLLQPVKSVTAAIGWSNIPLPREYGTPKTIPPCHGTSSCAKCPLADSCAFRK